MRVLRSPVDPGPLQMSRKPGSKGGKAHRWAMVSPFGPHEIVGMESERAGNRQFRRAPRRLQRHWRQVLKCTEFKGNLNQTVV